VDRGGDVGDCGSGLERDRVGGAVAIVPQVDADQVDQLPDRPPQPIQAGLVQDRDGNDRQPENRGSQPIEGSCGRFVLLRAHDQRGQVDPGADHLGANLEQRVGGGAEIVAVEDRVGTTQHAEQRSPPASILAGAGDKSRDLHQLDQHATDARQDGDRPQRRERVVADLDLRLGEGLEQ
jgi:hypothetical protein